MESQPLEEDVKSYRTVGIFGYRWSQHDSRKWQAAAGDAFGGKYLLVVTANQGRPKFYCEVMIQNGGGAPRLIHISGEHHRKGAMETAEKIVNALVVARSAA